MRYYVEACFHTSASGLVISTAPGERGAVLAAGACSVELRLTGKEPDATALDKQEYTLQALPWDSDVLRVSVNGISYGTGPLLLRDRDTLSLQPTAPAGAGNETEYTYAISVLPDPLPGASSSGAHTEREHDSDADTASSGAAPVESSLSDEDRRPYTIAANLSEYAKWNNFYSARYGKIAPAPAASVSFGGGGAAPMRPCVCGCYLPRVGRGHACETSADVARTEAFACVAEGKDAGALAEGVKTLPPPPHTIVTLFPSMPTLLEMMDDNNKAHQQQPCTCAGAVVSCCACPFLHPRTGRTAFSPTHRESAGVKASEASHSTATPTATEHTQVEKTTEEEDRTGPPIASTFRRPSPWSRYVETRQKDWCATAREASVNGDTSDSAAPKVPMSRSSAELLLRVSSLESALMGCRYE